VPKLHLGMADAQKLHQLLQFLPKAATSSPLVDRLRHNLQQTASPPIQVNNRPRNRMPARRFMHQLAGVFFQVRAPNANARVLRL